MCVEENTPNLGYSCILSYLPISLFQSKHRLFLIDYGLARRFRNERGEIRPPRRNIGFRGTLRYASLRVHRREEPGPADDLMSLYYTFIELIRGSVPWRKVGHFNYVKVEKEQLVCY